MSMAQGPDLQRCPIHQIAVPSNLPCPMCIEWLPVPRTNR